ncbi:protein SGT1 homolog isoform X2 [Anthonomus grandis grandis]|uniref:protein SGT1 homolog isoform X2 n=1 Tax=Anthonomus grandis grandis TaxID=2921223 RepID=UPI0021657B7A|nr:protein SGT1 homolog isoform X2 [Anthonomus grandis grandis]
MSEEVTKSKPELPFKHDWYQTDSAVVITILVKNIKEDQLKVDFKNTQVQVHIIVPEYEECHKSYNLSHKIVPEQSTYKLTPSKIEIKLNKVDGIRWDKLEGTVTEETIKIIPQGHPPSYPTSKKGKDWNQVEKEIKKQEEEEKPEGEEALNKLFQEIYGKGSDEVRKAMNKSFMESGGTVLSTNWKEVAEKKVEVKPPDGMEFKKWDS